MAPFANTPSAWCIGRLDFVIEFAHLSRSTAFHQNDASASASVFNTRESGLT